MTKQTLTIYLKKEDALDILACIERLQEEAGIDMPEAHALERLRKVFKSEIAAENL